jgi:hypothetical protein
MLVPLDHAKPPPIKFGTYKGKLEIPADFDAATRTSSRCSKTPPDLPGAQTVIRLLLDSHIMLWIAAPGSRQLSARPTASISSRNR